MENYANCNFAPQGWQCPVCGRVYSPSTEMCRYCGNEQIVTASHITVTDQSGFKISDWGQFTKTQTIGDGYEQLDKR